MGWLEIITLALAQGLLEFLPISSSAHLILVPELLGWQDQGLAFDVATHVGTLFAVTLYFRKELAVMARDWFGSLGGRHTPDSRLAWAVLIGTIPVGLAGLLFDDLVETVLRSPLVIAATTIAFGALLWWADVRGRRARDEHGLRWGDIAFIGCAQALAIVPGVSRSGITMTAALLAGFTREAAARYSFLLAIPVIALAGGWETLKLLRAPIAVDWAALAAAVAIGFASAYACIAVFLRVIARMGMWPFAVYRFALGILLVAVFA